MISKPRGLRDFRTADLVATGLVITLARSLLSSKGAGGLAISEEFRDGRCVLLTSLVEGQEATVLQLPAQPKTPAEEAAQKRVAYVG